VQRARRLQAKATAGNRINATTTTATTFHHDVSEHDRERDRLPDAGDRLDRREHHQVVDPEEVQDEEHQWRDRSRHGRWRWSR